MPEKQQHKTKIWQDMIWYLLGAMLPMLLNFIKTPIFTRHYSTEDYGYLGLVMSIYLYGSTVLFSWLVSCIWRYYHSFQKKKILAIFYSNLLFLFVISAIILLILSIIVISIYHDPILLKNLLILAFLHFTIKELLGLFLILIRIKSFSKLYNFLLILQVSLSFGVLCIMAFVYNQDISAMLLSSIVIDSLLLFCIIIYLIKQKKIRQLSIKLVSKRWIKIFFNYGSATLFMSLLLMLIKSFDRYFIAYYDTIENVGIYTKVFDLSQIGITALIFVFFNAINPTMNHKLTYDFANSNELLKRYVFAFLIVGIPFVFLASLFSKPIADLLLGENFRVGYQIMPYVFVGAYLYGLVIFVENKLKFANQLRYILLALGLCFIVNCLLNYFFVPKFGYQSSAIISLITYILMLVMFYAKESLSTFEQKGFKTFLIKSLLFILLIIGLHFWATKNFTFDLLKYSLEGIFILLIYCILFIKELKLVKNTIA